MLCCRPGCIHTATLRPACALFSQGWCSLEDVERLKFLLEKVGLLRRVSAPRELLRGHERAIQQLLRQRRKEELPQTVEDVKT